MKFTFTMKSMEDGSFTIKQDEVTGVVHCEIELQPAFINLQYVKADLIDSGTLESEANVIIEKMEQVMHRHLLVSALNQHVYVETMQAPRNRKVQVAHG